jgi:hypothetical protein
MEWDTAHRHSISLGQRNPKNVGSELRIVEKELIEVTEAKKEQRTLGQRAPDALILLHHRSP